jgi:hypothetical protein
VPSLAFAAGVYLPLFVTAPIALGGVVRWLVDRRNNQLEHNRGRTEEEAQAAADRSEGVLLASGYIAGGALAGIFIAITAGVLTGFDAAVAKWAEANNPLFAGPMSDVLTLLPYALLVILLYWIARERRALGG